MVQETFLRWQKIERLGIKSAEAWLITVVTRLCIKTISGLNSRAQKLSALCCSLFPRCHRGEGADLRQFLDRPDICRDCEGFKRVSNYRSHGTSVRLSDDDWFNCPLEPSKPFWC